MLLTLLSFLPGNQPNKGTRVEIGDRAGGQAPLAAFSALPRRARHQCWAHRSAVRRREAPANAGNAVGRVRAGQGGVRFDFDAFFGPFFLKERTYHSYVSRLRLVSSRASHTPTPLRPYQ